jgi:3-isopropylmalate/(R)-2-methylmalate dehydratase small subunit
VLVGGRELGHGGSGAAVARALAVAGVVAVVAGSFAAGFAEALLATGLPGLEVDAPAVSHTGQRLRINVEGGTIANLSSGDRQPVRNLTDEMLARLRTRLGR